MKVLGIIPARAGSKGIPRKNIVLLGGKPLLAYTAEAALEAQRLDRVILTTDDPEIAAAGRACGLEVPFMRPKYLAQDDTPTLPVIQHAVRWVEEQGGRYDAICLLQPTNPFRSGSVIDRCIELLERSGADAITTVLPVPDEYNPHWVYFQQPDGLLRLAMGQDNPLPRRQLLPAAYHREGAVYVTLRDVLMEQNSLYGKRLAGYILGDADSCVNIDNPSDLKRAEALLPLLHQGGMERSQQTQSDKSP
jgi:CMP-N-acetylneuraminic acid synthetase